MLGGALNQGGELARLRRMLVELTECAPLDNARRGKLTLADPKSAAVAGAVLVPRFIKDPNRQVVNTLPVATANVSAGEDIVQSTIGLGATYAGGEDTTNQWSYVEVTTNTGNNSGIYWVANNRRVTLANLPEMVFVAAHVSTGTITWRIGLFDTTTPSTSDPADGVYFRATNNGNWILVRRASSVETTTDTGIAGDTDPMEFRLRTVSTNKVEMEIDGRRFDVTTGLPAGTTALRPGIIMFHNAADGLARVGRWGQWVGFNYRARLV